MFNNSKTDNFFTLLMEQTRVTRDGVAALCEFCQDPTEEKGELVNEFEKKADKVRGQLVQEINHTFVTPIDREDLFRLSGNIDDLVDYAWSTVKELRIYDIQPDRNMLEMSKILLQMADGLLYAVSNLEKHKDIASSEAFKVKKLENTMDMRYHESIAELFQSDDFKKIMKYREVYRHLNHASDKGDMAADILNDITIKL